MKFDREFILYQRDWNDISFPVCCMVISAIEWGMLLVYSLTHFPNILVLSREYFWLLISAGLLTTAVWLLDRRLRHHRLLLSWFRLATIVALLLWSCLYTAYEFHRGNSPYIFAQTLMLLSAGVRLPTLLHCAINAVSYGFFVAANLLLVSDQRMILNEIISNAVLLFISWSIIAICNRIQYRGFCATQERTKMQKTQLILMAGQLEQMKRAQEHIMVISHDLRHFAWQVQQGVEQRDFEAIEAVSKRLLNQLEHPSAQTGIESYTGVAELDSILTRYARRAQSNNIPMQVNMQVPAGMDSQDLSLILLNALENAAAAVEAQNPDERRFLRIWSGDIHGQYFLEILNSYTEGSVSFDSSGVLPLSKRPDHGYGTRSMVSVLEQYHAIYNFQAEMGVFRFYFLLPEN